MASLYQLKRQIERLKRRRRLRLQQDAVNFLIVRLQQEGRKRVADWRRAQEEQAM